MKDSHRCNILINKLSDDESKFRRVKKKSIRHFAVQFIIVRPGISDDDVCRSTKETACQSISTNPNPNQENRVNLRKQSVANGNKIKRKRNNQLTEANSK
jgi:hypothetical protein